MHACMQVRTRDPRVWMEREPPVVIQLYATGALLYSSGYSGYPPELWRSYLLNSSRWAPGGDPPLLEPWPRQPGSPTQQQTGSKPASPANRQPVTQGKTRQPGSLTGQIICEDVRPRHLYPATRQQPGSTRQHPATRAAVRTRQTGSTRQHGSKV